MKNLNNALFYQNLHLLFHEKITFSNSHFFTLERGEFSDCANIFYGFLLDLGMSFLRFFGASDQL